MEDEICYYHKEAYGIYELFNTRYSLFKRVYTHRVGKMTCFWQLFMFIGKAIEYMIVDAMLLADKVLNISDAIDSPKDYLRLTDCVLKEIELSSLPVCKACFCGCSHHGRNWNRLEKLWREFVDDIFTVSLLNTSFNPRL